MRLAKGVEHRSSWIIPHAGRPHLVDAPAWREWPFVEGQDLDARGLKYFLGHGSHVRHHGFLVGPELQVDLQHGDIPGVLYVRVDFDKVFF